MDYPDRPIVILKTGDTHAPLRAARGDFEHWIDEGLGASLLPVPAAVLAGRFAALAVAREATDTPVPALC